MKENSIPQRQLEAALRGVMNGTGLQAPTYAVLIPLIWGPAGLELLLEVRAAGISQAGDPCFPGGRIEPGEAPVRAAVRETAEELGLSVDLKQVLGRLPTVQTYLGRKTEVFVCMISTEKAEALRANPAEVSELLRVPLAFFLDRPDAASYTVSGRCVWGMTAGAIRHLCAAWRRMELPIQSDPA